MLFSAKFLIYTGSILRFLEKYLRIGLLEVLKFGLLFGFEKFVNDFRYKTTNPNRLLFFNWGLDCF